MQAVEVKSTAPAGPASEAPPAVPREEASCCAPQSGKRSHRYWLLGAAAIGIPLALWGGWDWLAATGLATILIAVAPCLVMCALGLCMARGGKSQSGPSLAEIRKTYETSSGEPPSRG